MAAREREQPSLEEFMAERARESYRAEVGAAWKSGDPGRMAEVYSRYPDPEPAGLVLGALGMIVVSAHPPAVRKAMVEATRPAWVRTQTVAQERLMLLRKAIGANAWECLPLLHAFGCRLPEEHIEPSLHRDFAVALAQGFWSHPDLYCPELMGSIGHLSVMAKTMFRWQDGQPGAMGSEHLTRLVRETEGFWGAKLDIVCSVVSEALASVAFDIGTWRAFEALPHRLEGLRTLMEAGWVDENRVAGQIFIPWAYSDQLLGELTQMRAELLDARTAPALATPGRGPRL